MDSDVKFLVLEENREHGWIWRVSTYGTFLFIAICSSVYNLYLACQAVLHAPNGAKCIVLNSIEFRGGYQVGFLLLFFLFSIGGFVIGVAPAAFVKFFTRNRQHVAVCFVLALIGWFANAVYHSIFDVRGIFPQVVVACCAYKILRSRYGWASIGFCRTRGREVDDGRRASVDEVVTMPVDKVGGEVASEDVDEVKVDEVKVDEVKVDEVKVDEEGAAGNNFGMLSLLLVLVCLAWLGGLTYFVCLMREDVRGMREEVARMEKAAKRDCEAVRLWSAAQMRKDGRAARALALRVDELEGALAVLKDEVEEMKKLDDGRKGAFEESAVSGKWLLGDAEREEIVGRLLEAFLRCEVDKDAAALRDFYAESILVYPSRGDDCTMMSIKEMETDCRRNWVRWPERDFKMLGLRYEYSEDGGYLKLFPVFLFSFSAGERRSVGFSRQTWFVPLDGKDKGKVRAIRETVNLVDKKYYKKTNGK